MKYIPFFVITTGVILSGSSCRRNTANEHPDIARQLFMKSMYLTEQYIDSMENASDSTSLLNIVENFNAKITKLNYQFPPDTDYNLSEEENDSLIRMFKHLEAIIDEKLKRFGGIMPIDSLEMIGDSLVSSSSTSVTYYGSDDSQTSSGKTTVPPSHIEHN